MRARMLVQCSLPSLHAFAHLSYYAVASLHSRLHPYPSAPPPPPPRPDEVSPSVHTLQVELAKPLIALLQRPYHERQAALRPNVIQARGAFNMST